MRSRILTCITSAILFARLVLAVRLDAQEQQEHFRHYRVFNLGTLRGTSSSGNTINNLSWTMGSASLIPDDSALHLISAGGINDKGEITGQAYVLSNGACTSETPAFLAIPRREWNDKEADVSLQGEVEKAQ